MSSPRKLHWIAKISVVVLSLVIAPAVASTPSAARSGPSVKEAASPSPSGAVRETLNRQSPRSAMAGFLDATSSRDYARAAEYLDLSRIPRERRTGQGPALARELRVVIDQVVPIDLDGLSDQPAGSPQAGPGGDRALIGTVTTSTGKVDLLLQRMPGPEEGRVWKVAASTVSQIPRLHRELGYGPLADYLPPVFFEIRFLEIALWQWLALLLLVALASAIGWIGTVVVRRVLTPIGRRAAPMLGEQLLTVAAGPIRLALSVAFFFLGSHLLNLSLSAHQFFREAEKAIMIAAVAWVIVRVTDVLADLATDRLRIAGRPTAIAVVPLGRKATKVVIVVLAMLAALQNIGINVTGILAGLGIGGLAVALAAQKTVENLFGGVSLILDQPVRVGDFCRFGDRVGTVEEVGLRSTRIRTLDRTVVSIPNGHFAGLELENFTVRDRIWLHMTIGLRYETTPDQLRHLLVQVRRMLYAHPLIDPRPARIRFVNFGAYSLDLEIFAYVLTADYDGFLAVQEDVNLRIMELVAESGSSFAFPSQTTYFARDPGLDQAKVRAAEAQVEGWRREGTLPLPEFPPEAVTALNGTIDYPPRGSAGARPAPGRS